MIMVDFESIHRGPVIMGAVRASAPTFFKLWVLTHKLYSTMAPCWWGIWNSKYNKTPKCDILTNVRTDICKVWNSYLDGYEYFLYILEDEFWKRIATVVVEALYVLLPERQRPSAHAPKSRSCTTMSSVLCCTSVILERVRGWVRIIEHLMTGLGRL